MLKSISFMPARKREQKPVDVLCDLDVILERTSAIKLGGQVFEIAPITTTAFFDFAAGLLKLQAPENKLISAQELDSQYLKTVSLLIPELKKKDVEAMTMVQKAVLLQHLSEKITGTPQEDSKKKQ